MTDETIMYRTEKPDSIEIGTPSKGGVVKIYFNSEDKERAKIIVGNAIEILNHAINLKEVGK